MIDTHCHILPGIDDGARDIEQALELARYASENGISDAICTPHIQVGVYDNQKTNINEVLTVFRNELRANDVALNVHLGAEVRICPEIMFMIANDSIPFIGTWDSHKVMLLELPHNHIPVGSDKLVRWLMSRNIRPMIAHPERNREIISNSEKLNPFVMEGCLLQLTSASISGGFGKGPQKRAIEMLEKGWATVIATDAHNINYRPPDLAGGFMAAKGVVGTKQAELLVYDNPRKILSHC